MREEREEEEEGRRSVPDVLVSTRDNRPDPIVRLSNVLTKLIQNNRNKGRRMSRGDDSEEYMLKIVK